MTRYIKQPNGYGCMVASVAMVVERPYEEIERECAAACFRKPERPGIGEIEAFELLHRYGFAIQRRFRFDPVTQTERPEWPCDPWAPVHIAQVHATQGPHAVVMLQDGKVLDPFDEDRKSLRDPVYTHLDWIAGLWQITAYSRDRIMELEDELKRIRIITDKALRPTIGGGRPR